MKIIQFTAENVKKLKVVDITPTKDFIQITGKNGSGKSSVLDSIWWALAGKEAIQDQPIRKGEEKAVIRLNLGDMIVTRCFTKAGTTLVVENADGFRAATPQAMLDAIIGHLSFDPLEFSRMAAKQQFDTLRHIAAVKIDFEAFAEADKKDTEKRRDINRDVKNLEVQMVSIVVADDAPDVPVSVTDLMKQLTTIEDENGAALELISTFDQHDKNTKAAADLISKLQSQLLEAHDKYADLQAISESRPDIDIISTDDIKGHIAGAEKHNAAYTAKKRRAEMNADIAIKQKISDKITEQLEQRAKDKMAALKRADMPINGLSLGDGAVIYNDIPFDQLSAAEQLRVSVAIAMAANPKLRVIRIKDGSLLDDASLKIIQDMAVDFEYQVWIERVDTTGKIGIVMEDGEIKTVNEE